MEQQYFQGILRENNFELKLYIQSSDKTKISHCQTCVLEHLSPTYPLYLISKLYPPTYFLKLIREEAMISHETSNPHYMV